MRILRKIFNPYWLSNYAKHNWIIWRNYVDINGICGEKISPGVMQLGGRDWMIID